MEISQGLSIDTHKTFIQTTAVHVQRKTKHQLSFSYQIIFAVSGRGANGKLSTSGLDSKRTPPTLWKAQRHLTLLDMRQKVHDQSTVNDKLGMMLMHNHNKFIKVPFKYRLSAFI